MLSNRLELTANGPELTARAESVPESHNGSDTFSIRIAFSDELKEDFSYVTMRDHAFTLTGGEVTKASRRDPPSNWRVGDKRQSGRRRQRDHRPAANHGLRRPGGHLHRRRPEAVQPDGTDRQRNWRLGQRRRPIPPMAAGSRSRSGIVTPAFRRRPTLWGKQSPESLRAGCPRRVCATPVGPPREMWL